MKVLYIIHSCIMGGASISFYNLVEGIRAHGIEVSVVLPDEKNERELSSALEKVGCKNIYVPYVPCSWFTIKGIGAKIKFLPRVMRLLLRKSLFYARLGRIIKTEKPDIIHINTGVVHEGLTLARKNKIPHVWHLREYQLKDFDSRPLPTMRSFKKALRKSHTVCITKDIQRYFELDGYDKSYVVYNPAMSEKQAKKYSSKSSIPYFLVANRISREKGIEDILVAFSKFYKTHADYSLKICGFGSKDYVELLKKICIEQGVTQSVEFLGYADTNLIYSFMKSAKALVVGSYNEGFGRMTAEANMLGVPVIGRNSAGTKEILLQTNGGLLFDDEKGLLNAMDQISKMNSAEIQNMMKEPQVKAMKLFSEEQHIKAMMDIYNKILRGGGKNRLTLVSARIHSTFRTKAA